LYLCTLAKERAIENYIGSGNQFYSTVNMFVFKGFCHYNLHSSHRPKVDFTNNLFKAFMRADPKSAKRYWQLYWICTLLRSSCIKAARKMLIKSTPNWKIPCHRETERMMMRERVNSNVIAINDFCNFKTSNVDYNRSFNCLCC